jgi:hypothetical protein
MDAWQFGLVTIQYLVGAALTFSISLYILLKNPKSSAYKCFSLYGLFSGLWTVMVFFHRNAPTANSSLEFFAFSIFFIQLAAAFLLVTLIMLHKEKLLNLLILAPAFIIGALTISLKPFYVVPTDFGWSYKLMSSELLSLFMLAEFGYTVAIIIAGALLSRKSKTMTLKKKYTLITYGFIIFYAIGLSLSNFLLFNNPNFPPFGGLFVTSTFLVVAYAINLPPEKIEKEKIKKISVFQEIFPKKTEKIHVPSVFSTIMYSLQMDHPPKSLKAFLDEFLSAMPGKELGQDIQEFDRFLSVTGLNKAVLFKKGKIIFDGSKLSLLDFLNSMDKILEYVKGKKLTPKAVDFLTTLFLDVYRAVRMKSKLSADEWLSLIITKHEKFLSTRGILKKLPPDARPEKYRT